MNYDDVANDKIGKHSTVTGPLNVDEDPTVNVVDVSIWKEDKDPIRRRNANSLTQQIRYCGKRRLHQHPELLEPRAKYRKKNIRNRKEKS